jgi:CheY-like chemotaxis protein
LDAGATRPEISDFPIQDLFQRLDIEFAPMAKAKGLELEFIATALNVRSDRRLMRRLLQNFVSNAVKYTLQGRVLVGCRRRGAAVRIEVWDTGIGVPEHEQRRIFDEFRRLDQGARAARGLGLGLSIVERLGRVLAHPITLRSRPGAGSMFAVEAPLGTREPARAAEPNGLEPTPRIEPLAGLRVLAIDNEPRVLDGMRALLQKWGCRVTIADGFAAALASLAARPDVIIADYHLDDADGLAVIAALRERLGYPAPAILATADRSPEVRDAAAAAEVALLNKPLKPAPLRAQLSRCLALRAAAE